jgi:hypothetical protein
VASISLTDTGVVNSAKIYGPLYLGLNLAVNCRSALLMGKWRSQTWSPTWKGGGLRVRLYFLRAELCANRRFLRAAFQRSRIEMVSGSSGSRSFIDHKLDRGELGAKDIINLNGESL